MALAELYYEKPAEFTIVSQVREKPNNYNKQPRKTRESARTRLLKQIPLEKLMDLKIDYAFKQLFGSEKNKKITIIFLNAILQKTGRNRIKDILFTNIEAGGEYADDKQSRLDLLVVTDADEQINVEVQFTNKYNMIKRSIYYWAGVYRNPFTRGMDYHELQPVIAINILNFNLLPQTERFHTSFHLYEDDEHFKLTNTMEFHFIEMTKLIQAWQEDKLDPWNDVLARWLLMLGMVDHRNKKVYDEIYKELEEIAMKDEALRDAFESWTELSMDHEQWLAYESRLKRVMDEESFRNNMEAMKREIEQGQKKIEHGKKEIEHGKKELEHGKKELEHGKKELEHGKKELEHGKKELEHGKKELEQEKQDLQQKEKELRQKEKEISQREEKWRIEQKDTALRLIKKGLDIEFVAESTGLDIEEVEVIRNRHAK
ncbi:Rpn family recombination-promoting nuclease/putative transposase [Lederbergia sp. NSJ-179]|uniref:Rpn family recombination-promoting nuclease/putative transposase n=1 Tax=Lederbergia sp. NSJ-179 TaxID=2931402 RepID=UPI001FD3412C|nr:Rpn family recombination-promoting nuclease/putative transposase [Lederbergia sp. NSJ-179]MCJ7839326.1 Rpn family recombination-promoting nuclease/putative transposase [Lederbergia sp. NSJ-179]